MKKFKINLKIIGLVISFILLLLCSPYLISPIYDFSGAHSFSGNKFYNPYSELNGIRIKANFHAHTKIFFGLTAGKDDPDSLWNAYKKLNYDLLSISNYHSLTPRLNSQNIYITNYEHGINIFKNHLLMIGAGTIDYFNFPFYQSIHQKQFQINRLKDKCKFLVITHPKLRHAYSSHELANLNGYDAIEIYSRFSDAEDLWDSVLSSGRSVWGFNDDDSHDKNNFSEVGSYWNYIYSSSEKEDDIISALKLGRFVNVRGHIGFEDNYLKNFTLVDSTINIELEKPAKLISFIGQNGEEKRIEQNNSKSFYTFTPNDTYIRIVVINDSSKFYFNPVYRYKTSPIQMPAVTINYFYSFIYWIVSYSLFLFFGSVLIKRIRSLVKNR